MAEVDIVRELAEHGGTAGLVIAGIATIVGLYVRKHSAPQSDDTATDSENVAAVVAKVDAIDQRLARVESDVEHLPTKDEFHAMDLAIVELQAKSTAIDRMVSRIDHRTLRMEDFLMKIGGSK